MSAGRHALGVEALEGARIEVEVVDGIPAFTVAQRPDRVVRELRERLRAALVNAGFEFPAKRITIVVRGPGRRIPPDLEVAIAAALLVASGQVPDHALDQRLLRGGLALDGSVRRPAALAHLRELGEGTRGDGARRHRGGRR